MTNDGGRFLYGVNCVNRAEYVDNFGAVVYSDMGYHGDDKME